jgi:hypothetical protein
MLGKPKYKEGETVKFIANNELKTGFVFVVDKFGTWDYTEDVSYDIMVESENCLYKHIPEKYVVQRYYSFELKSFSVDGENIIKTPTCRSCKHRIRAKLNQFSPKVVQCCELQPSKRSNSGYKTIKVTNKACERYERKIEKSIDLR